MLPHFFEQIQGWFNFRGVYEDAIREAADGARFVEVGTWYGRSAAWMAVEIANSGKQIEFYCVDTWKGSVDSPWMAEHLRGVGGSCKELFVEAMRGGGVLDLVRPLEMPSRDAAAVFADNSLDFVFIDAAHDYDSVRDDVRAWYPKVKTGGVLAGDDVQWPGVIIGVRETIPHTEYELVNDANNWRHRKVRRELGSWITRQPHPSASDYLVFVPYVNNAALLDRAVRSLRRIWPSLVVMDQSEDGLQADWLAEIGGVYRVPFRAISFTETMNWARAEAFSRGVPLLAFMHSDAECVGDDLPEAVIAFARERLRHRIGVTFTHYDAFAVFSVEALRDTGPWDESFRWYFADNDYYRRLRLTGWRTAEFGGDRVRHALSQTQASDPRISAEVAAGWDWHMRHYAHKWGGNPGHERFTKPYNGIP
jgi:predicted O-methyltransferase YrrM